MRKAVIDVSRIGVQTLFLESPLSILALVGQLPRSVDVRLEDDLVDRLKPGDRVCCVAVLMES